MLQTKKFKIFTMVEMLVVVLILGILASFLYNKLKYGATKTRDTARKADLIKVSGALNMYSSDEPTYPRGSGCLVDIESKLAPKYIQDIPLDPNARRVTYGTRTDGCPKGSYGYAILSAGSNSNAGGALIANLETPSHVGNFTLPPNHFPIFTGSINKIQNTKELTVSNLDSLTENELVRNTAGIGLNQALIIQKLICGEVVFKSVPAEQNRICLSTIGQLKGIVEFPQEILYVDVNYVTEYK